MRGQYKDENGNTILSFEGQGIIAIPGGFKSEDMKPLTKAEWRAIQEEEKNTKPPRNLAEELDALKAENESLKLKLKDLETNVDRLKKP